MKYTEKMILLPADIAESSKPVDALLNSLDIEMQKILNNNSISPEIKLAKYNQVLARHQRLQEKKHQPYKIDIIEESTSDDEILAGIPQAQHQAAKTLLHYIQTSPYIKIEQNGELVINGRKIYGSNIVDLVHDLARGRKTIGKLPGTKELMKALNQTNIPIESIGNKAGKEIFVDARSNANFDWDESL